MNDSASCKRDTFFFFAFIEISREMCVKREDVSARVLRLWYGR